MSIHTSKNLIYTIGVPGSGKSTWAANNFPTYININRDIIRTELFGEDYHFGSPKPDAENKVTAEWDARIKRAMERSDNIVIDDTNIRQQARTDIAIRCKDNGYTCIAVPFNTPLIKCLEQNQKRGLSGGRYVPPEVILNMAKRLSEDTIITNMFPSIFNNYANCERTRRAIDVYFIPEYKIFMRDKVNSNVKQ